MKRVLWGRKVLILVSALAVIGVLVAAGAILQIRKARVVLSDVRKDAESKSTVPLKIRDFSLAPNRNAQLFSAPYNIRDMAAFQEKIYAATSNGLVVFGTDGRKIDQYTPLEGFPSTDLTSIAVFQDTLWIGTADSGLIRLKSNKWSHFQPSLQADRSIHSLLATSQGTLLAGTENGVLKIEDNKLTHFLPALKSQKVTSLSGNDDRICIGTFESGLYTYEAGVLEQYSTTQGLTDPYVTQVSATTDGCYVSTASGVQILETKKFRTLAKNLFATSFAIEAPILWIATRDRGVIPINTLRSAATPVARTSALQRRSSAVVKKVDTTILLSSGSEISYLENGKEWRTWSKPDSLFHDGNVSALLKARNGELWVGYFDRGLDILSSSRDSVTHLSDDTLFCVNHISEDQTGRVYVSTANGLVIFASDRSRKIYRKEDGLLSDRVMQTLPLDPEGKSVAIATTQGFTLKEGESMKSIYAFHGLVNNHVYTMTADGAQLYLGTLGGISRVNKMQVTGSWTQMDSGLKRNWVNALMSIDNKLFVGTYGSGVQVRTENGEWLDFPSLPEDLEVNPNAFYFNGTHLFCGTLDRGFFVYDTRNASWKNMTRALPSLNVTAFASDRDFVFVGTDRGLLQIKYEDIRTTPDIL